MGLRSQTVITFIEVHSDSFESMPGEPSFLQYISDIEQENSDDEFDYPQLEVPEEEVEKTLSNSGWIKLNSPGETSPRALQN